MGASGTCPHCGKSYRVTSDEIKVMYTSEPKFEHKCPHCKNVIESKPAKFSSK